MYVPVRVNICINCHAEVTMCPEYLFQIISIVHLHHMVVLGVVYRKDYGLESPLTFYIVVYIVNIFGLPYCVFTWL